MCQLMMYTAALRSMYADDLALVASSPEELQAMLDIVATYADKWQYHQLNVDKSSVMARQLRRG